MPPNSSRISISAQPIGIKEYWQQMFKYRHLLFVFTRKEVKSLYAQTYFGLAWVIIRPIFILSVFTVIFKFLLHVRTQSPYYLFAFAGMIAWNFFSQIATTGSTALIQNQNIIHKMYFPKLILPLSKVFISGIDLAVSLLLFFLFVLFEGIHLTGNLLVLPVFILLNICCGFAVAVWMNALNIRFRDLNQIVPPVIGIAIWITPVFYPTTIIPAQYDFFVYANPMAGIIKGYRFALLAEAFPEWQYWISIFATCFLMLLGIWYLSRVEDNIVDFS
jgi:lipopolysaccharide transport system permease protein